MSIVTSQSRSGGFSLIEVVLAVGIISFCLVSLMSLLTVSMNTSKESSTTTSNSLLFQKVVNQLRVAVVERDTAQSGQTGDANRYPLPAPGSGGTTEFSVDEFNRYVDDGDTAAVRVVTVNVMTPVEFKQVNGFGDPVPLAAGDLGGKSASVCVTIRPAHGAANAAKESFSSELNLVAAQ